MYGMIIWLSFVMMLVMLGGIISIAFMIEDIRRILEEYERKG